MPANIRLDWSALDLPYRHGHFRISAEHSDRARTILVSARDRDGMQGLGEAVPSQRVVGADTDAVHRRLEDARRLLSGMQVTASDDPPTLPWGPVAGPAACAVDSVLLDLWARHHATPLWRLLGLPRGRVPTSATISLGTPEAMAKEARQHGEAGFRILKIKLGTTVQRDLACLHAVREAAPDATLRIDGNEGWDLDAAVTLLPAMAESGVELIEQPLPRNADDEDLRRLTRVATDHEVAHVLDEGIHTPDDARRIAAGRLAHGVNLKLQKAGGLRNGLKVIESARDGGLGVMIGCFIETWAGISLALQAAAVVDWVDLDGAWLLAQEPVVSETAPLLEKGLLSVTEAPGLGLTVAPRFRSVFDEPTTSV